MTSSIRPHISDLLFGFMVLRAAHRVPVLPPLDMIPFHIESTHLEGSYSGTVVTAASRVPNQFFYPQRNRKRRIFSATEEFYINNDETEVAKYFTEIEKYSEQEERDPFDSLVENMVHSRIQGAHFLSIDQVGLNASVTLMVRNVQMRMYGVYSPAFDLLVWTNLADYPATLRTYPYDDVWTTSFEPVDDICRVLHTRRICSRWHRWSKEFNPLQRFAILERMILGKRRSEQTI
jgi:hypothetical protein